MHLVLIDMYRAVMPIRQLPAETLRKLYNDLVYVRDHNIDVRKFGMGDSMTTLASLVKATIEYIEAIDTLAEEIDRE